MSLDDPRIARLNLAYHDVTTGGLRTSMEASGLLRTLLTEGAAENAKSYASPDHPRQDSRRVCTQSTRDSP